MAMLPCRAMTLRTAIDMGCAGETGVIGAAGRQWLSTARLLCDCLALRLQRQSRRGQEDWHRERPQDAADDDHDSSQAAKRQRTTHPERVSGQEQQRVRTPTQQNDYNSSPEKAVDTVGIGSKAQHLPPWHTSSAQLRAYQQAWRALLSSVQSCESRRVDEHGAQTVAELQLELQDALGRTAGLDEPRTHASDVYDKDIQSSSTATEKDSLLVRLQRAVAKEAVGCSTAETCHLQGLAVAAVHAVSRATVLLAWCVGPTHMLRGSQRVRFVLWQAALVCGQCDCCCGG